MLIETELLNRVEEITMTDYEPYNTKHEDVKLVVSEKVLAMIEDLICEVESLQEKLEDTQNYYENNYKFVPEPDPDIYV